MDEDALNTSIRKFLKEVGVTSQREIEKAVRAAVDGGKIDGTTPLPARMVLSIPDLGLTHEVDGAIRIE